MWSRALLYIALNGIKKKKEKVLKQPHKKNSFEKFISDINT